MNDAREVGVRLRGAIADADDVGFASDALMTDVDVVVAGGEVVPGVVAEGNVVGTRGV